MADGSSLPQWLQDGMRVANSAGGAINGWFGLDGGSAKTSQQVHNQQFPEKTQPTADGAPIPDGSKNNSLTSNKNLMLLAGAGVLLLILVKK